MGQEGFTFWGAAAIPALGPFVINWVVRGKDVLKSSGADFLLLLVAFDLTAAISAAELAKFIPDSTVKQALQPIVIGSLFFTLVIWLFVVKYLEPLYANSGPTNWRILAKKLLGFVVTWGLTATFTTSHIYIFFHKGGS